MLRPTLVLHQPCWWLPPLEHWRLWLARSCACFPCLETQCTSNLRGLHSLRACAASNRGRSQIEGAVKGRLPTCAEERPQTSAPSQQKDGVLGLIGMPVKIGSVKVVERIDVPSILAHLGNAYTVPRRRQRNTASAAKGIRNDIVTPIKPNTREAYLKLV